MQRSKELFAAACDNFELHNNTEKTVVMHQPLPNTTYTAAHRNVNGTRLKSVYTFTYLGRNLSRSTKVDDEITHRIVKDSGNRNAGTNRYPQHMRPAEIAATALERPLCEDGRQATTHTTILWRYSHGFSSKGGRLRRYKDTLKTSLKQLQINTANWEDLAQNRTA
ncbi:unnamed protein product [Schistocephalus solidus]|uniref:Reverse transcriptase domain-containing protein n=1 Tax=Schistocephalus solidus TaxID=70667 RepID=A0A183SLX0_SCHSO|nr:unnamed protein product [Schistocephalus solidus]